MLHAFTLSIESLVATAAYAHNITNHPRGPPDQLYFGHRIDYSKAPLRSVIAITANPTLHKDQPDSSRKLAKPFHGLWGGNEGGKGIIYFLHNKHIAVTPVEYKQCSFPTINFEQAFNHTKSMFAPPHTPHTLWRSLDGREPIPNIADAFGLQEIVDLPPAFETIARVTSKADTGRAP